MNAITKPRTRLAMVLTLCLALAAIIPVSPASAGMDTDLRAGFYTDVDAFMVGGGLLSTMGSTPWFFNPNAEVAFFDGGHVLTLNGDFHYDLPTGGGAAVYLGGGPALIMVDPERGDSNTDFGLNLLGGVAGRYGAVRPFGQLKGIMADGNELVLMGGVRF